MFSVLVAASLLAGVTALGSGLRFALAEVDVAMLYLAAVVVVSYSGSWWLAVLVALVAVGLFDFFFVEPFFTFAIDDARYVLTFSVMTLTGVAVSVLATRARRQCERVQERARQLEILNALADELVGVSNEQAVTRAVESHARRQGAALVPESALVQASISMETSAKAKLRLEREVRATRVRAEAEELRNAVLSAVSHDLRTPLAFVLGGVTTLADHPDMDLESRRELTRSIESGARRLARQLDNLLHMTRAEGGALRISLEWIPPEEVFGAALQAMGPAAERVQLVDRGPALVEVDPAAIEAALVNLLSNALTCGENVVLEGKGSPLGWEVRVLDDGPGFDEDDLPRIFEKFRRGQHAPTGGAGLGLAIVAAMVRAHAGEVWARNRQEGGGDVGFALPLSAPPEMAPEADL